jgi:hypothetical protein
VVASWIASPDRRASRTSAERKHPDCGFILALVCLALGLVVASVMFTPVAVGSGMNRRLCHDSVVIQAEKQILRSALRGSYWRAVGRWAGGAVLYTFLLLAFAIGLAKSGIDLGGLYQKIVSLH